MAKMRVATCPTQRTDNSRNGIDHGDTREPASGWSNRSPENPYDSPNLLRYAEQERVLLPPPPRLEQGSEARPNPARSWQGGKARPGKS